MKSARSCAGAVALIWLVQLLLLGYFFATAAWSTYWFCRDLYHPGLSLFGLLGRPLLPARFSNPLDRTAVLTAFAFSALFYAVVVVLAAHAVRRSSRR